MNVHSKGIGGPRFEVYLPIQCMTPGGARPRGLAGKTRSVSAGGLEVLLPEILPLSTPVLVRIGGGDFLRAHVIWVERATPTSLGTSVPHGLTFDQLVDPDLVRQWVYRAERQYHARATVLFPVDYTQVGTAGHGTCLNLSRGGMFLTTTQPAPAGSQVSLTFNLPTLSHTFSVLGHVVWMREKEIEPGATTGMGVQFLDLKPSEAVLIESVVHRHCGETSSSPDSSPSAPSLG